MKVGPSANYSVGVRPQEWEEPNENAALYRGIFQVELQHHVGISFVPDVSAVAPPWDFGLLPDDIDTIATTDQARLATALFTSYVVTPNDRLAGTHERFSTPGPPPEHLDEPAFVFYVTADEFERYADELDRLTDIASGLHVRPLVDDLRDREVIAFIERRIVASSLLKPYHAELLGQTR
jgi:hypothetical protein